MSADIIPVERVPRKQARILLVEDSVVNQRVTLLQLRSLGYSAEVASNGLEALAALQRAPFDIVLMDCQMPEMGGYETTWQIRDLEKERAQTADPQSRVYIIALTANTGPEDREKCLATGMDDYIGKPVQQPALAVALQRALADPLAAQILAKTIDPLIIAGLRHLREPGQPDLLVELIDLFLVDARTQLAAIETAVTTRNMGAALTAASSLKGSAGNLGAHRLAGLCTEIEGHAWAGSLSEAVPVVAQAREEFVRVESALENERKLST